ncbi:DUF177 domain-containing protein [Bacillus tianshenii]|nr:DUF177 domain-containing protein [Bacillus tianshenii]
MEWQVSELRNRRDGFEIDETIDVSELKDMNKEIRQISPVHVTGNAHFSGSKITFDLTFDGEMILPCARSLADVKYPFEIDAREIFSLNGESYTDEDLEIHGIDGEVLDLKPYIRENILLEIPMQVFSDNPETEGKAPQSGQGWEVVTEEEQKERIDPRLEKLQQFFKKDE